MGLLEPSGTPSRRDLFWFGMILPIVFAVASAIAWLRFDSSGSATFLAAIGLLVTIVYAVVRALRIPIYVAWMRIFFPVGWTVSHVVLVILYYLVVTPVGLVMRLVGHDPMKRRLDRSAPSYWIERPGKIDPARYFRQF